MSDTAHISRNGDGSLEHRVSEYLEAQSAYESVKLSRQLVNDPKWADTLGHEEDIDQAEKILEQSLSHTTSAIDQQDLKSALSQKLMTEEQAQEFSKTKVQMEFEKQSGNSKQAQADKFGHRQ